MTKPLDYETSERNAAACEFKAARLGVISYNLGEIIEKQLVRMTRPHEAYPLPLTSNWLGSVNVTARGGVERGLFLCARSSLLSLKPCWHDPSFGIWGATSERFELECTRG